MSPFVLSLGSLLAEKAKDYAIAWAHKSVRARGKFIGEYTDFPIDPAAAVQAGYSAETPCRFVYCLESNPLRFVHESGTEYMVSDGVSDGGSTPPITRETLKAWADLQPYGKLKQAFYFHDGLYRDGGCFVRRNSMETWQWMRADRAMADVLFYQAMTACDAENGEIRAIYYAVRAGAGVAWANHRARQGGK